MIYLDNAATSYPKPRSVLKEVARCIKHYGGNPGRSAHSLSIKAAEKIYDTREKIAEVLNYPFPERIVFTPNATYALNMAIKGLINEPCHCLISDLEHNSVIRPLNARINSIGGKISVFKTDGDLSEAIRPLIREDTRFIVCTSSSNVTGRKISLEHLSKIASENGIKLIIDLSQSIGHYEINASKLTFAALCAPGHKALLGLQGSGFVVFGKDELPCTLIEGGSGNETLSKEMPIYLPERMEGGTLFTPAIASLCCGIEYIQSYGEACIERKISDLTERMEETFSEIPSLTLYGAENGIAAFNIDNVPSEIVARYLAEEGICVRGGLHCAPLTHSGLGTINGGAVRASVSIFNSHYDIDRLYRALKKYK